MKFISFLASTMLIVLISQHSTVALPLNDTTTRESCSQGYEMVDGHCIAIKTKSNDSEIKSSTTPDNTMAVTEKPVGVLETTTTLSRTGACREGFKRSENGICEEIKSNDQVKVTDVTPVDDHVTKPPGIKLNDLEVKSSTTPSSNTFIVTEKPVLVLKTTTFPLDGACDKGFKHGKHGICEEIKLDDQVEITDATPVDESVTKPQKVQSNDLPVKSSTTPSDNIVIVTKKPSLVLEATTHRPMGGCREGFKHGKHGICEEIKSNDQVATTEATPVDESVTKPVEYDIPKGCPKGTKADEQGACIGKRPQKTLNTNIDPKLLLNKDGSCPPNYKKIQGRCLYVKPKPDSLVNSNYFTYDDNLPSLSGTKYPVDKHQFVPVLSDNSCPEGTEYSSYGLCRRRPGVSGSNVVLGSDVHCQANYEFVKGKCVSKKSTVESLMDLTTKVTKLKNPSTDTDVNGEDQPIKSTTEVNPDVHTPVKHRTTTVEPF